MTNTATVQIVFKQILVPMDLSDVSRRALGYAKKIARIFGSRIVVTHVSQYVNPFTPPEGLWMEQSVQELEQLTEERLEHIGEELRSEGFQAQMASLTGGVDDQILDLASREKADLIILGTEAKKGLERLFFGSKAEDLARCAGCPVVVIGPCVPPVNDQVWHPRSVFCPVDLDPGSIPIAVYASQLSEELCASLTLLHVETVARETKEFDLAKFERSLAEAMPREGKRGHTWKTLVSDTAPGPAIAEIAKAGHADLIIMGAHSASNAAAHWFRGIAPHVFADAPCPVMTLHVA
jgi:nucleotide-binding universal stress UspA family protein